MGRMEKPDNLRRASRSNPLKLCDGAENAANKSSKARQLKNPKSRIIRSSGWRARNAWVDLQKERMTEKLTRTNLQAPLVATFVLAAAAIALPMAKAQQSNFPVPTDLQAPTQQLQLPPLPMPTAITPNGSVVEDMIARVNDQIITRSEYEKARDQLVQDGQQRNIPPAQVEEQSKNLLRDMIDQQLLLSKGKELGITGDAEVTRQLDEIRKQNHLDSMEALQRAAEQQGVSFEDFKQRIRDQIVSQKVVSDEVGRRLNLTHAQEVAYYNAHSSEFQVPEQEHLSEILIPTPDNATDAQISAAQAKADDVEARLKGGAGFSDLAKTASGGPTASAGGDLGDFKRGTLGTVLENATFSLAPGAVTAPIRTRQGFVILRVDSHQAAGVPPLSAVEGEVQQAIYLNALQPALRAYLTQARQDAYVEIQKGFVDSGAQPTKSSSQLAYTTYKAPPIKKKTLKKQRMETVKAEQAQAALAAAREKLAEKKQERAAESAEKAGVKNVDRPIKPRKIRREKIRFGEAPRNALPAGNAETAVQGTPAAIAGQAPGVAMAPTESVTTITTGVGDTADADTDPLNQATGPTKKTRFTSRETEAEETKDKTKLAKAEAKADLRPKPVAPQESATEKHQAQALGLNGDTEAKQPKKKRQKGEAKERLQAKPAPAPAAPIDQTVNPNVVATPGGLVTPAPASTAPSSDKTVLPPPTAAAPNSNPTGQPIPATTSADPKSAQQPQ